MKTYIWVLTLFGVTTNAVLAGPSIGFGVRAGVGLAAQNLPNLASPVNQGSLLGLNGGVFAEFPLTDFLSLQPEACFVQKGSRQTIDNFSVYTSGGYLGTTTVTFDSTFNDLELPLLLRFNTKWGRDLKAYLLGGAAFSILLNETATLTFNANGNVPYSQGSVDDTNFYPSTDWSVVFGAGVEYLNFLLEIRNEWGFNSMAQNGISDRSQEQNNVLSIQLGYRLL